MVDDLYPGASELEGRTIREIVALAMDAPAAAKSGHSGTAMALAPLGVTLFSRVLRHDPTAPEWPDRDRFILSCGHASILQYGLAHAFGYDVSAEDLREFRQPHSKTPGHPENGVSPTVEVTTGPLGQGIANAVGMAVAERVLRTEFGSDLVDHRVWVLAGDGCLQEGISHEAASFAGAQGLSRLTVFYDDNHITIDGATELAFRDDTPARFRAYGWHVIELAESANQPDVLEQAARQAIAEDERPTLIVLRSHIGFPSETMMDRREAHGSPFSASVISETKSVLGVPDEAFTLSPELPAANVATLAQRQHERMAWYERVADAAEAGHRLHAQFESNAALHPSVMATPFEEGSAVATRKALQRAMDTYFPQSSGMTAGSADLTDNTGVLLKSSLAQSRQEPGGRQIYYGVREFAMGAMLVGQALHGGLRPIGSTFFVFSDYMRPALRMAALSHASALFVFTHDSVGVGEDGPTHQPVEHLMGLRAMPRLHVVRPSDANETLDLVQRYLSKSHPPATAIVLSRQDIPVMGGEDAIASAEGAHRGAYVLREDEDARFTLIGTGSEVAQCLRAHEVLSEAGIATRVIAMPCWECFEEQGEDYRAAVLRREIPSVALEAGATLGWQRYADAAIGIDSFGLSGPGGYLFEHFGLTADAVVRHVRESVGA